MKYTNDEDIVILEESIYERRRKCQKLSTEWTADLSTDRLSQGGPLNTELNKSS